MPCWVAPKEGHEAGVGRLFVCGRDLGTERESGFFGAAVIRQQGGPGPLQRMAGDIRVRAVVLAGCSGQVPGMDSELGNLLIDYECRRQVANRKLNGRSQVARFLPRREQAGRTITECVAPIATDGTGPLQSGLPPAAAFVN